MTVTLILPPSISANVYWRSRWVQPRGGAAGFIQHYVSPEARDYREEVGWRCKAAGIRAPLIGRLHLDIQMYPHRPKDAATRERKLGALWDDRVLSIDLGNCEKVLSDALQNVGVFTDDSQLWEITMRRREPDGEARVVVVIRAMTPAPRAQGALL